MLELKADCFEHEIAKLLTRYQDKHSNCKSNHWQRCSWKDQLTTPDAYIHALKLGLGVTSERFASPLSFNPDMETYYSIFDQDRVFGANINAFSSQWTGASQANPDHEPQCMEKAVRWAILSAEQASEASLTVFVMPKQASSGYYKSLAHPTIRHLCNINKENFKFKSVNHWQNGQTYNAKPKEDVLLFISTNQQGLGQYVKPATLLQLLSQTSLQQHQTRIEPQA